MLQGVEQHRADSLLPYFMILIFDYNKLEFLGLAALIQLMSTQKDDPRGIWRCTPLPLLLSVSLKVQFQELRLNYCLSFEQLLHRQIAFKLL